MPKITAIAILMLLPLSAMAQVQTSVAPATPNLSAQSTQPNPNDPSATYCRPPQRRTDSMLMGPKICMTNQQWNDLHASGFDIAPDGRKVSLQRNSDMLTH